MVPTINLFEGIWPFAFAIDKYGVKLKFRSFWLVLCRHWEGCQLFSVKKMSSHPAFVEGQRAEVFTLGSMVCSSDTEQAAVFGPLLLLHQDNHYQQCI